MPYKDADKQREANKERARRYRAKHKGVTHKPDRNTQTVTPKGPADLILNFGQPDCQCAHCRAMRANNPSGLKSVNHGTYKPASQLGLHEVNRVSLPGDVDYKSKSAAIAALLVGG